MKISITVPKCLNWLMAKMFPVVDEDAAARAMLTGKAMSTTRYGNHLASIEVQAVYERDDPKSQGQGD